MITGETTARLGWYCVRTQPRREHTAAASLRSRVGVDVFAPGIRVRRSPRHVSRPLTEPLFPGYLFARFSFPHQLRHVVSTQGVAGVVSFGGEPPVVADGVIEFLRTQIQFGEATSASPIFEEGEWVKIVSGCFRDCEGRVLSFDAKTERVRLLLSLLGREVQVSVLARQVVPGAELARTIPAGLLALPQPAALSA